MLQTMIASFLSFKKKKEREKSELWKFIAPVQVTTYPLA